MLGLSNFVLTLLRNGVRGHRTKLRALGFATSGIAAIFVLVAPTSADIMTNNLDHAPGVLAQVATTNSATKPTSSQNKSTMPLALKNAVEDQSMPATTYNDSGVLYDAWMYPDAPGAMTALQDGRHIHALKAEFLHVNDDGTLDQYNQSDDYPNGYSPENVAIMSKHSEMQYITVSGSMDGTALAMQNQQDTINKMVEMADKTGFGIELDWEDFGQWTPDYYQNFKVFVQALHTRLAADGHRLTIDGPPIYDASSQNWYQWKYEELAPLADNVVMMIYDNQYDEGAGSSIAPESWSLACMKWLHDKAGSKGIAGVAAYGYSGDGTNIDVNTTDNIKRRLQQTLSAPSVTRNSDGELTSRSSDGTFFDFADQKTMDTRLQEVQNSGISELSVWSLGDNPWFSQR